MKREKIKNIALANGFKLKAQADGNMDLNPYVYEFAGVLLSDKDKQIAELVTRIAKAELAFAVVEGRNAELEKALIAPTDNGFVALDSICEKFNSNKEANLNELVCSIWNKAYFEALKEQGE